MDRFELHAKLHEMRKVMFDEGFLNKEFMVLEYLQQEQPDFVETIIVSFLPSTTEYIRKMGAIFLETEPRNLTELERLTLKLKGASASLGAAKLLPAIDEMLATFRRDRTDTNRLSAALGRVRSEHTALKGHLEPYAELLAQFRGESPPNSDTDSDAEAESVASNNVNV